MAITPPKVQNIDVDVPIEEFGGLITECTAADIPFGASPFCQDVDFQLGAVFTRAGLTAQLTGLFSGNCNYLKTFSLPNTNDELLLLDSAGGVWSEDTTNAPGALSAIGNVFPNSFATSVTQFGREWLAFNDGVWGFDAPRQWDGTFFDRVSQDGPGLAPSVVDETTAAGIVASPNGLLPLGTIAIVAAPNGLIQTGNVVTVTVGTPLDPSLLVGQSILIAGAGVAAYNGTWKITNILGQFSFQFITTATGLAASGGGTVDQGIYTLVTTVLNTFSLGQFTVIAGAGVAGYNTTWRINAVIDSTHFVLQGAVFGLAASGNGTASPTGNITAGVHKVVQIFLTRQGYLTAPSPIGQWTAGGGLRAIVSGLAIGPTNVIARWLGFTAAGGGFFFVIPVPVLSKDPTVQNGSSTGTVVKDNTSNTFIVDFNDVTLLNSFSIDSPGNNLFNLVVLAPAAGVISYSNRMFWWGELAKIQNFINMGFDGGFGTQFKFTSSFPLGWTQEATGGGKGTGVNAISGDSYDIMPGVGSGKIHQSAYRDSFDVAILQPNTTYSFRVSVKTTASALASSLKIQVTSPSTGFTDGTTIPFGPSSGFSFSKVIGHLMTPLAVIPSDLVLQVFGTGLDPLKHIYIDELEVFPTDQPYFSTSLRASYNSNPESFDGVTGRIGISNFDGQVIKSCFKLRDNLYIVKEGSLYVTQDNGATEPFGWTVSTISTAVGTPSIRGVAVAEEYAFIVNQMGVYMFNGSEPVRVNQEIKPVSGLGQGWDTINWSKGSTIWVTLDINNRHLLIGAPTGESQIPNQIFMMNYRELDESYAVASGKPIHNSYMGKLVSWDMSRKWCPWNISANCCAIVRRQDLSLQVWFGNNSGNGKVYQLDSANATDDGLAIQSQYWTFFFVNREMEQGLQVGSHRHLYTYMACFTSGVGILSLTAQADSLTSTRSVALAPRTLSGNPNYDIEVGMNFSADRVSIEFATDGQAGSTFFLSKMTMSMRPDPWMPVRGRV